MAQRDIILTLAAGESREVPIQGADFFFLKYCDRQLGVVINNQRVNMNAGEKRRLREGIEQLHVENLSDTLPLYIEAVVGDGDYQKIIVSGEIRASQEIKTASGVWVNDSRESWGFWLNKTSQGPRTISSGTLLQSFETDTTPRYPFGITHNENGVFYSIDDVQRTTTHKLFRNDADGNILSALNLSYAKTAAFTGITWDSINSRFLLTALRSGGNTELVSCSLSGSCSTLNTYFNQSGDLAVDTVRELLLVANATNIRRYDLATLEFYDEVLGADIDLNVTCVAYHAGRDKYLAAGSQISNGNGEGVHEIDPDLKVNDGKLNNIENGTRSLSIFYGDDDKYVVTPSAAVQSVYVRKVSTDDYYGELFLNDGSPARILNPDPVEIKTPITYSGLVGLETITGEVIKVLFEVALGNLDLVPADYMDYVYRVEYFDGTRRRILATGSKSFSSEGILDSFTMSLGESIKITLRAGIL